MILKTFVLHMGMTLMLARKTGIKPVRRCGQMRAIGRRGGRQAGNVGAGC